MTTGLLAMAVAATPLAVVVGLLRLVDRLDRRRAAGHARQIELTEAIHREMGAAAAPTVEMRRGGGWRIRMMVPLDRPATVAAILRVTGQVFTVPETAGTLQIILTAAPAVTAVGPALSRRRCPVQSVAPMAAAAR